MEKEGFVRSIAYLNENGLEIGELVTDRHVQLVEYIREEMPDTSYHLQIQQVFIDIENILQHAVSCNRSSTDCYKIMFTPLATIWLKYHHRGIKHQSINQSM